MNINQLQQPDSIESGDNYLENEVSKIDAEKIREALDTLEGDINTIQAVNDFVQGGGYTDIPDSFDAFISRLRMEGDSLGLLQLTNDYIHQVGFNTSITKLDLESMMKKGNSFVVKQGQTIDVGKIFGSLRQASLEHYQGIITEKAIAGPARSIASFETINDARLVGQIMEEYRTDAFLERIEAYNNISKSGVLNPIRYLQSFGDFKNKLLEENRDYEEGKQSRIMKETHPLYNIITTLAGNDILFSGKNIGSPKRIEVDPDSNYILLPDLKRESISPGVADYLRTTIGEVYPLLSPHYNEKTQEFRLILDLKHIFTTIKAEQTAVYMETIEGSSIGSTSDSFSESLGLRKLPTTEQYVLAQALTPRDLPERVTLQQQSINARMMNEFLYVEQQTGKAFTIDTNTLLSGSTTYTMQDILDREKSEGLNTKAGKLYKDIQNNMKHARLTQFVPKKGEQDAYEIQWHRTSYSDKATLIQVNFMDKRKGEIPPSSTDI